MAAMSSGISPSIPFQVSFEAWLFSTQALLTGVRS